MGRIDTTIHIRPSLDSVQEAQYEIEMMIPIQCTHIVMTSIHNFLVIGHDKEHQCFICNKTGHSGEKEKYIY